MWIKQDDTDVKTKEVLPQGYKILYRPRSSCKTRGGLALVYRDHYSMKELDHIDAVTMGITLDLTMSPSTCMLSTVSQVAVFFSSAMGLQAS